MRHIWGRSDEHLVGARFRRDAGFISASHEVHDGVDNGAAFYWLAERRRVRPAVSMAALE
jgi:hypothetical protein